jgi:hypothetical protein
MPMVRWWNMNPKRSIGSDLTTCGIIAGRDNKEW